MKIVGVSACTVGIAHTYMAKKAMQEECAKRGFECKVEAQGGMGIEDELTQEDVDSADLVIETIDVGIEGEDRFEAKVAEGRLLKVGTADAIANAAAVLDQALALIGGAEAVAAEQPAVAEAPEPAAEPAKATAAPGGPMPAAKQSIFAEPGKTLLNAFNTGVSYFIPIVVIGHVTKDGAIAGPRMMEHMVDVVLYFEGERNYQFRILRGIKNRFGSTNESGLFTMTSSGLSELENPSQLLLAERAADQAGSAVAAVLDGMRPMLGEIQALTAHSVFAVPRRTASGMDYNRLIILLAVLEKRLGVPLGSQDVYINVVGGLRLTETAADLPVALAVYSSLRDISMDSRTVVMGEVGLTGDIRRVPQALRRVKEAAKMGFNAFILPKGNLEDIETDKFPDCHFLGVATLREAIEKAFRR